MDPPPYGPPTPAHPQKKPRANRPGQTRYPGIRIKSAHCSFEMCPQAVKETRRKASRYQATRFFSIIIRDKRNRSKREGCRNNREKIARLIKRCECVCFFFLIVPQSNTGNFAIARVKSLPKILFVDLMTKDGCVRNEKFHQNSIENGNIRSESNMQCIPKTFAILFSS